MTKYSVSQRNNKLGTIEFLEDSVLVDFPDPKWQLHFLQQVADLKPLDLDDLVRSGYSNVSFEEEQ